MRYFTGFLIVLSSVIFWMLPVADSIYAWKTESRTDTFTVVTAPGITSGNSTLVKSIYNDDVSTIILSSDLSTDIPVYSSYNGTSKKVVYTGLSANTTRQIEIQYDTIAFDEGSVFEALSSLAVWLLYIFFIVFPLGGLWVAFRDDIIHVFT
jgi:hypothetical protein